MFSVLISSLADLFINLSAGWFGAAIILPVAVKRPNYKPRALIINIEFGILSLLISVVLRSYYE